MDTRQTSMDHKDLSGSGAGMSASTTVSGDTDETCGDVLDDPLKVLTNRQLRRFKRYPAYKDSGIGWLRDVPANWNIRRVKCIFHIVNGATPASGESIFWDGDIPWVTPEDLGDLSTATILEARRRITKEGYRSCGTTIVPQGSLVLSTRAPIGHLAIAGMELCTNQGCKSLIFLRESPKQYFFYQLLAAKLELQSWGQGSTFQELGTNKLANVPMIEPSESEQRSIAAFLDREIAKIDALVAKKERLMDVLQEKRISLVTRTVTNGLDPNILMKDSGVEWLGKIPAHWAVKPLKFVSSLQTGLTLGKNYDGLSVVVRPYLRVANVQDGYLALEDVSEVTLPANDAHRYELRVGDVLMTEGGDFDKLGRGHIWSGQIAQCVHQNHIFAVRPSHKALNPRYLSLVMGSGYGRAYFTATSTQSTNLASTNSTKLRNLPMPLPDIAEQDRIVAEMGRQISRIDGLITKVRTAIAHAMELRTALINAAVTGKIDVREEAA